MNTITIERAKPEDAAAVLDYLKTVGGETDNLSFGEEGLPVTPEEEAAWIREQVDSTDRVLYLAKQDGRIVGDANLDRLPRRMNHRGEMGISVLRSHWGQGIGRALMERLLAFAREHRFEQVNLEVRSDNTRAIRLYEAYGFEKLATFPAYYKINGEPIDFDWMILTVQ